MAERARKNDGTAAGVGGERHVALGKRLREERTERGISLRELARRLEVSPSLVSQIETGKIQPSVRTLYAMVSELGVSLDDVFGSADPGRRQGEVRPGAGDRPALRSAAQTAAARTAAAPCSVPTRAR